MKKSRLLGAVCAGIISFISFSSQSALVDNGGGLIYDTVLDITWSQPETFDRGWDEAKTWAEGLTLGEVTGWRLPYTHVSVGDTPGAFLQSPVPCSTASEIACRDNELGYMFYQNLGGTSGQPILSSGHANLNLFTSLQSRNFWSSIYAGFGAVWISGFSSGGESLTPIAASHTAWAVHAGNVSAVPLPATAWLFTSGLLGLIGTARARRRFRA